MDEFMTSLYSSGVDVDKGVLFGRIKDMINDSELNDKELFHILNTVREIRTVAHHILLMNYCECKDVNSNTSFPFNHGIFDAHHVSCITDLLDFLKLLELKYSLTLQEELKMIFEEGILTRTNEQ